LALSAAGLVFGRAPAASRPALELLALLLLADAVTVLLHVVNELGGFYAQMFNLDLEGNLPTWLASAQFLAVAAAAGLLARQRRGRERLAALALGLVFAFFSLDEVALVHEKLAEHAPAVLEDVPKLPILYSPIAAACAAAIWVLLPSIRDVFGSVLPFIAGFALLVTSLLLDAADVQALDVPRFRPLIILEEATELAGTALLATVLLAVVLARGQPAAQRQESEPESVNVAPASGTNRQL
jgi:hypothetical protein